MLMLWWKPQTTAEVHIWIAIAGSSDANSKSSSDIDTNVNF